MLLAGTDELGYLLAKERRDRRPGRPTPTAADRSRSLGALSVTGIGTRSTPVALRHERPRRSRAWRRPRVVSPAAWPPARRTARPGIGAAGRARHRAPPRDGSRESPTRTATSVMTGVGVAKPGQLDVHDVQARRRRPRVTARRSSSSRSLDERRRAVQHPRQVVVAEGDGLVRHQPRSRSKDSIADAELHNRDRDPGASAVLITDATGGAAPIEVRRQPAARSAVEDRAITSAAADRLGRPTAVRHDLCDHPAGESSDLVAILLVVLAVLLGFRSGALPQVGGLLGAIGGGALVILALPLPRRAARQPRSRRSGRSSCWAACCSRSGSANRSGRPSGGGSRARSGPACSSAADRVAGRLPRRGPGAAHHLAGRRPAGHRPGPAPDRGGPDLDRGPRPQRGPAAADRDRGGARRPARRVRAARGLRRLRAPAPPAGRAARPTRRPGRSPRSPRPARSASRRRPAASSHRAAASSSPTATS